MNCELSDRRAIIPAHEGGQLVFWEILHYEDCLFVQNQFLQVIWFTNLLKNHYFSGLPFGLKAIFEDPQKSSMIFYRKDLTAKIMLRTHMLFLKLPKIMHARTHTRTSIFRRFPHNSPKGANTFCCIFFCER